MACECAAASTNGALKIFFLHNASRFFFFFWMMNTAETGHSRGPSALSGGGGSPGSVLFVLSIKGPDKYNFSEEQ